MAPRTYTKPTTGASSATVLERSPQVREQREAGEQVREAERMVPPRTRTDKPQTETTSRLPRENRQKPEEREASRRTDVRDEPREQVTRPAAAPRPPRDDRDRGSRTDEAPNRERAPQKTVTDLKSVLRTMVNQDKKPATPPARLVTKPVPDTDQKPAVDPRESLKAALASAIGKPVETYAAEAVGPAEPVVVENVVATATPVVSPQPRTAPTPPDSMHNPYAEMKSKRDPLAPKQLERMMRVTGNDRNPFRP